MKHKLEFTWHFDERFRLFCVVFDRCMWNVMEWDLQLGWLQVYCYYVKKEMK